MRQVDSLLCRVGFPLVPLLLTTDDYNRRYAIKGEHVLFDDLSLFRLRKCPRGRKKATDFKNSVIGTISCLYRHPA